MLNIEFVNAKQEDHSTLLTRRVFLRKILPYGLYGLSLILLVAATSIGKDTFADTVPENKGEPTPEPEPEPEPEPTQAPTRIPYRPPVYVPPRPSPEPVRTDPFQTAKDIFGSDFLGTEAVERTFGISLRPEEIPQIQFSQQELERAKALSHFLILRLDREPGGQPLTMRYMNEKLQPQYTKENKGKILFLGDSGWYKGEDFFTKDVSRRRWALVSSVVIPDSMGKTYLDQTQVLAEYIKFQVFQDNTSGEFNEAISEFIREQQGIARILSSDWKEASNMLSKLKLNQLARHTPTEALYDSLVYFQNKGSRLLGRSEELKGKYTWTNRQASGGVLVYFGSFGSNGAYINPFHWDPLPAYPDMGSLLSR